MADIHRYKQLPMDVDSLVAPYIRCDIFALRYMYVAGTRCCMKLKTGM
jgi:hypothetical protein